MIVAYFPAVLFELRLLSKDLSDRSGDHTHLVRGGVIGALHSVSLTRPSLSVSKNTYIVPIERALEEQISI